MVASSGMKEFAVREPDGYVLGSGEQLMQQA